MAVWPRARFDAELISLRFMTGYAITALDGCCLLDVCCHAYAHCATRMPKADIYAILHNITATGGIPLDAIALRPASAFDIYYVMQLFRRAASPLFGH